MGNVGKQCIMLKQITEAKQKREEEEEEEDEEEMMSGVEAMIFFLRAVHEEAINKRKRDQKLDEFSNQAIKRPKLVKEEIRGRNFIPYHAKGGQTVKHYKEKNKLSRKSGETKNEHKCKKCNKVYETHQSLGGHMRAHYEPKDRDGYSPVNFVKEITENLEKLSLSSPFNEDVNTQLSLGHLPMVEKCMPI